MGGGGRRGIGRGVVGGWVGRCGKCLGGVRSVGVVVESVGEEEMTDRRRDLSRS